MGEKNLPFIKGKDLMERNICPVCGKMDCIFLTKDKHCKEMMDLYHSGDIAKANKIFMQRYAQFLGMQRLALKKPLTLLIRLHISLRGILSINHSPQI